jgi:hypothetical protein
MAWSDEPRGRNEYMTLGPFKFPHQRDAAANDLCRSGRWHMHSSDLVRETGEYFCIMARYVEDDENA